MRTDQELRAIAEKFLVDPTKAGRPFTFASFKAAMPDAVISEGEFIGAQTIAETIALGSLGLGAEKQTISISRSSFQALAPPEQAKYIGQGGRLYDDPEPPKADHSATETITNKRGERMLKTEFDSLDPKDRMEWCVATA